MIRILQKISLYLVFTITPFNANAENVPDSTPDSALQFYDKKLNSYVEAPGVATEIEVDINGLTAYTTLTQYYLNNTNDWQEGKYTYPIPEGAAVHALTMMLDNKRVIGFVHEKQKAKAIYQKAKENGQAAGLVDQHRRNIFQTSVANIPPQSLVAISIEYQTEVNMDDYVYSYRLPLAITPRYDSFHPETLVKLASSAEQPWAEDVINRLNLFDFKGGENPVHLHVSLNSGFDVSDVKSASHAINTNKDDEGLSIYLEDEVIKGEQDFLLEWAPTKIDDILVTRYSEAYEGSYYSQIMIMPPRDLADIDRNSDESAPARHISFVIDTSGSMAGTSIEQAKKALIEAVESLAQQDVFSIIEFNSDYKKLLKEPMNASPDNKAEAVRKISQLEAQGGTVFDGALKEAFGEVSSPEHMRQIVFITDGAISYEEKVIRMIEEYAEDSDQSENIRLFTIGIGDAPNGYLMKLMAETGRGSAVFISDVRMVKMKMNALFSKMTRPALTNVVLELPDNVKAEMFPSVMPDLLAGDPVQMIVKSDKPLGRIEVHGQKSAQTWDVTVAADDLRPATGLHKLYARRKMAELESPVYRGDYTNRDQMIVDLGVLYQVVSSKTSLVAVDEDILRPAGQDLFTIEHDPTLPKGWKDGRMKGHDASRAYDAMLEKQTAETPRAMSEELSLPRTASGYMRSLMMGVILLVASGALFMGRRRIVQ